MNLLLPLSLNPHTASPLQVYCGVSSQPSKADLGWWRGVPCRRRRREKKSSSVLVQSLPWIQPFRLKDNCCSKVTYWASWLWSGGGGPTQVKRAFFCEESGHFEIPLPCLLTTQPLDKCPLVFAPWKVGTWHSPVPSRVATCQPFRIHHHYYWPLNKYPALLGPVQDTELVGCI